MGEPKGTSEGDGEGPAPWNPGVGSGPEDTDQGCRLPEESEEGEGRTCISLALHPLPQPAGHRLGRLYSDYVTPERGSRVSKGEEAGETKREERRGAAVRGWEAPPLAGPLGCPSEEFLESQPSPTPYPSRRLSFLSPFFPSHPSWQGVLTG